MPGIFDVIGRVEHLDLSKAGHMGHEAVHPEPMSTCRCGAAATMRSHPQVLPEVLVVSGATTAYRSCRRGVAQGTAVGGPEPAQVAQIARQRTRDNSSLRGSAPTCSVGIR